MRAPNALNTHNEWILINVYDSHIAGILISKTIRKVWAKNSIPTNMGYFLWKRKYDSEGRGQKSRGQKQLPRKSTPRKQTSTLITVHPWPRERGHWWHASAMEPRFIGATHPKPPLEFSCLVDCSWRNLLT